MGLSLLDARSGYPIHLRNLGSNFIDFALKNSFEDSFSPVEKIQAKELLWNAAFGSHSALLPDERPLIKEKMASNVALLACRMWLRPDEDAIQWNSFFVVDLMHILTTSSSKTSLELGLLCVARLIGIVRAGTTASEESDGAAFNLPEGRRVQLHSGLEIVLPNFMTWLFQNFPAAAQQPRHQMAVLTASLECFQSVCTWLNGLPIEGLTHFSNSCFLLLNSIPIESGLTGSILEAMNSFLASRCFTPSELSLVESLFEPPFLNLISGLLQRFLYCQNPDDDVFDASFQSAKSLIGIICTCGTRFLGQRKTPVWPREGVSSYLSLLIQIGQVPSISIRLDLISVWSAMIRSAALIEKAKTNLATVLSPLLTQLMMNLAGSRTDDRRLAYNKLDFEDANDFKEFWALYQSRCGDLIRLLSSSFPRDCLQLSYNALGSFVQSGGCLQNPKQWEALLQAQESVIKGISDSKAHFQLVLNHLQLLQNHAPLPQTTPLLLKWIDVVRMLVSGLAELCPRSDFECTVHLLFSLSTANHVDHQVQNTAASSLVRLADTNPTLFSPLLEGLLTACMPLLSGTTSSSHRRLFSEIVLILMVQPSISIERQAVLFASVADPLVNLLQSAKNTLLSSQDPCRSLMTAIGCAEISPATKLSKESYACRADLNTLIATLQILFRRVGPIPYGPAVDACANVLDELVSFLMIMIQCTHRINGQAAWTGWEAQFTLFKAEISSQQQDSSEASESSEASSAKQIVGWVRNCRQTCYQTLSLATTHFARFFFRLPGIADRFMSQPLSFLDCLNLGDWTSLLKGLLLPTLIACPEEFAPQLNGGCLTGLFAVLAPELQKHWQLVREAANSTAQGAALSAEVKREQTAHSITAVFVSFLNDLLLNGTSTSEAVISLQKALEKDNLLLMPQFETSSSGKWFLTTASFDLQCQMLKFLICASKFPRSAGHYARLVSLAYFIVSSILTRKDFPFPAKSAVLNECIEVFLALFVDASWTDYQTNLVILLTELYKWSFSLAANEKFSDYGILDSDTKKFVSTCSKLKFECEEILLKAVPNRQSVLALRNSILLAEIVKSQRSSLRTVLVANFKSKIAAPVKSPQKENSERDLASKLHEMKKRLVEASQPPAEDLNLSDLFEF